MKAKWIGMAYLLPIGFLFADFSFKESALHVQSSGVELHFQNGIISYLKNRKTGEVLTGKKIMLLRDSFRRSLLPEPEEAGQFKRMDENTASVVCKTASGAVLTYTFRTEGDDILFKVDAENFDVSKQAENIDIHLLHLIPDSIIAGDGTKMLRTDPKRQGSLLWSGAGYHFPRVLLLEMSKGVVMIRNESYMPYHNIVYYHTPESDHIVLHALENNLIRRSGKWKTGKPGALSSSYWRISPQKDWLDAARRWRKELEEKTGAVPLWKNPAEAARNIHAVYSAYPPTSAETESFYKALAKEFDPPTLLLFHWNAFSIVQFGDHTYFENTTPPKQAVEILRKYGFQWMPYYGYILLVNEKQAQGRIQELTKSKSKEARAFPAGYKFTPDYDGKPEDFYKTMMPAASGKGLYLRLNLAHKAVRDYLVRNMKNYAKAHHAGALYLDVFGNFHYSIEEEKQVFDGMTYYEGEVEMLKEFRKEAPNVALMSEYAGEWIYPYIFYSWVECNSIARNHISVNHPFRAALTGSYFWSRESPGLDVIHASLYASLPKLNLEITGTPAAKRNARHDWSEDRVKLFTQNRLFHDLPERWDDAVYAYYRSQNGKGWFQLRKMPFGAAYVKEENGTHKILLGRYQGVGKGIPGFSVQDWLAYDSSGAAIGMNPAWKYEFSAREADHSPVILSSLPEKVWISRTLQAESAISITLESDGVAEVDVSLDFKEEPLQVFANGISQNVSSGKIRVKLPGTMVFLFREGVPVSVGKTIPLGNWDILRFGVNGLFCPTGYGVWYFNFQSNTPRATFGGKTEHSLRLGASRYGIAASKPIQLPKEAKLLAFRILQTCQEAKAPPMHAEIVLNGKTLWNELIPPSKTWEDVSIDISSFAGQPVLLTLIYRYNTEKDILAKHCENYVYFGGMNIQ